MRHRCIRINLTHTLTLLSNAAQTRCLCFLAKSSVVLPSCGERMHDGIASAIGHTSVVTNFETVVYPPPSNTFLFHGTDLQAEHEPKHASSRARKDIDRVLTALPNIYTAMQRMNDFITLFLSLILTLCSWCLSNRFTMSKLPFRAA